MVTHPTQVIETYPFGIVSHLSQNGIDTCHSLIVAIVILTVKGNVRIFFEKTPFLREFLPCAGKLRPDKPIRRLLWLKHQTAERCLAGVFLVLSTF
jgi:hypothetical protein